jgi:hypothetical protein
MTDQIAAGDSVLFMKIGIHANEPLEEIIRRKKREIEETGFGMWGYGGNTCHPGTMVQPFARDAHSRGKAIKLWMHEMKSDHRADPVRASLSSPDDIEYTEIPRTINVRGSRFALCIKDLHEAELELPLDATQVALGNSKGRLGSTYIQGRVDKACLTVVGTSGPDSTTKIDLVAELVAPYAVYLK